MNQEIQNFLSDLYKIDGDLIKYENELVNIIENLLKAKPDAKFDEEFKERLKAEILAKVEIIKKQNIVKTESKNYASIFNNLFLNRFSFAIGGAVLIMLIMLPFLLNNSYTANKLSNKFPEINLSQKISKLDKGAFGKLNSGAVENGVMSAKGNMATTERAYGLGGGGGAVMDTKMSSSIAPGEYFPRMINYEYVYTGTDFTVDEKEVEVLRRLKDSAAARNYSEIIKGINIDLLDLNKFKDTELINISINENREFGYSYSLSFTEGISLYSNWDKWPHPEQSCRDEACYASFRLKESDVPADDELISITDNFVKEYGIDMSHYGAGKVQDYWRQYKVMSASEIYIPEDVAVIYPLIINGKEVYEVGGGKSGLGVNVNIRYKKVSAVYSIIPQNYESSNYDAVTSVDDVLGLAKKGGMTPSYRYDDSTETIKLELDAPSVILLKYYSYNQDSGKSEELIIPALLFPVKDLPSDTSINQGYFQQNVIVPLVKEVFDQYSKEQNIPGPILYEEKPVDSLPVDDNLPTSTNDNPDQVIPDVKPTDNSATIETLPENATNEKLDPEISEPMPAVPMMR